MFVDSSVIVAILSKEPDATAFAKRIKFGECLTSALVILESTMRLSSKLRIDPIEVAGLVELFLREADMKLVPVDGPVARLAVEAFAKYGKGRGHKAQLNLADCLSYACAKAQGVDLLYKGNDFAQTDLA
jgi:ribonuclease VapC